MKIHSSLILPLCGLILVNKVDFVDTYTNSAHTVIFQRHHLNMQRAIFTYLVGPIFVCVNANKGGTAIV